MQRIALLALLALLTACSSSGTDSAPATGWQTALPRPGELQGPARQTSGSLATVNRTLVHPGEAFAPWPGFSANAELGSSGNAILHGSTSALTFVMYELSSAVVGPTSQVAQIWADISWPAGEPSAPEGMYIGLPDHTADRWVWIDARDLAGGWLDVTSHNIFGLDPGPGVPSYLAFVNFSGVDAHIGELRLRFYGATTSFGDEFVYYMSRVPSDPALATSVSRMPLATGIGEVIHATDLATVVYGVPVVADFMGAWKLFYSRHALGGNSQIWYSELDGSGPAYAGGSSGIDWYPGGWNYGYNHALIIQYDGATGVLYGSDVNPPPEIGRFGRSTDNYGKVVWDISADPASTEFAAIGALETDALNQLYTLVRVAGNPPFPIDATPSYVYLPLIGEDARDPAMTELADFFGNPEYWIYFAAKGRDDASYNIYRVRPIGGADPEPVYVDPAYDLRHPAISPDGRYLAFVRLPLNSTLSDEGEIMLSELLTPEAAAPIGPTDATGFLSWYDPTP